MAVPKNNKVVLNTIMKKIKINSQKISKNDILKIADYFKKNKIVVYPAETIYGLGSLATNSKNIEKLYQIKKREKEKSFIVLVKSFCMLKKYFFVSAKQDKFLRKIWPKPFGKKRVQATTVILKSRGLLPKILERNGKIAVRIPMSNKWGREFLIPLIKEIDEPIISTSLNISGKDFLLKLDDVEKIFPSIDLAVDIGVVLKKKISKIIDISDMNNIKTIR